MPLQWVEEPIEASPFDTEDEAEEAVKIVSKHLKLQDFDAVWIDDQA